MSLHGRLVAQYAFPPVPSKGMQRFRSGVKARPTNALHLCEQFDAEMLAMRPVHCPQCDGFFFGVELIHNACAFSVKFKIWLAFIRGPATIWLTLGLTMR